MAGNDELRGGWVTTSMCTAAATAMTRSSGRRRLRSDPLRRRNHARHGRARRHRDDRCSTSPARTAASPSGVVRVAGAARRIRPVRRGTVWDEHTFAGWCAKERARPARFIPRIQPGRESKLSVRSAETSRHATVDWYRAAARVGGHLVMGRLSAATSFDFDALLRQPGSTQAAPDGHEIARQWARVHRLCERAGVRKATRANLRWQAAAAKSGQHFHRGIRLRGLDPAQLVHKKLAWAGGPYRRLPPALKSRASRRVRRQLDFADDDRAPTVRCPSA